MQIRKIFALQWQGIDIEITYYPFRFTIGEGEYMAHAELTTENREPLPITQTGYLSHHFPSSVELSEEELIGLFRDWLDEKASKPEWIEREAARQQLTLF